MHAKNFSLFRSSYLILMGASLNLIAPLIEPSCTLAEMQSIKCTHCVHRTYLLNCTEKSKYLSETALDMLASMLSRCK